jgi:hypothetical protein
VAPVPRGSAGAWWHPRGFLTELDAVSVLAETPFLAVVCLSLPAALLTLGVCLTNRSAWARALAVASTATVALFAFYAFVGMRVWEFFSWRGTLVLVATGMAVGLALTSALLAESWLRRHRALQLLLYLPLLLGVVAVMRHSTGTNETMAFNLSPWPALPVMGFDLAVYTIGGVQLGLAAGLVGQSLRGREPRLAAMLWLVAALLPIAWLLARHPSPGSTALIALAGVTLVGVGLCATPFRRTSPQILRRRALHIAVGACLVLLPVIAGQSLAAGDYAHSRFVRAQALIDQLAAYYEQDGVYPDELEQLISGHYLDELPHPRVGFELLYDLGWLEPIEFSYQNLGSGYVLEFEATEWVQCAYSPPWSDEEEELEDGEEMLEIEESWSCPDARPDLW